MCEALWESGAVGAALDSLLLANQFGLPEVRFRCARLQVAITSQYGHLRARVCSRGFARASTPASTQAGARYFSADCSDKGALIGGTCFCSSAFYGRNCSSGTGPPPPLCTHAPSRGARGPDDRSAYSVCGSSFPSC